MHQACLCVCVCVCVCVCTQGGTKFAPKLSIPCQNVSKKVGKNTTYVLRRLVIEKNVTVKWGNILPSSAHFTITKRVVRCTQDSDRMALMYLKNHGIHTYITKTATCS